MPNTASLNL